MKVAILFDKFVPLINAVYDLCDLLKQVGKTCPLKKGPYDVGPVMTKIPGDAPSVSSTTTTTRTTTTTDKAVYVASYYGMVPLIVEATYIAVHIQFCTLNRVLTKTRTRSHTKTTLQ